jgi:hypothetical protein
MGHHTLRISVDQHEETTAITLEGRIAGPWADELYRTWAELAPSLAARKLLIDLCNATYADPSGIQVLREIYSRSNAQLITSTPWTEYLADEITRTNTQSEELGA